MKRSPKHYAVGLLVTTSAGAMVGGVVGLLAWVTGGSLANVGWFAAGGAAIGAWMFVLPTWTRLEREHEDRKRATALEARRSTRSE